MDFRGDRMTKLRLMAAIAGVDSVLHLAYVNGTEYFYEHPELILDIAVRGMLNVLDACRAEKVPELVLASSSEAYHQPPIVPTPEGVPLVVPDPLNPRYSYGGGKLISELMALNWGRKGFERVMIFRPHNVYGPDMGWEHVIPDLGRKVWRAHLDQDRLAGGLRGIEGLLIEWLLVHRGRDRGRRQQCRKCKRSDETTTVEHGFSSLQ